ncbi:MAG: hypothetical protein JW881_11920 [Spirochaetales bacterium]|nr:hypothetical protein [Spirochaetales bacterium]
MVTRRLLYAILLLFIAGIGSLFASGEIEPSLVPSNARSASLGGPHAAMTDDHRTIFHNPAGLRTAESGFLLSELTLHLTGPVFDVTGALLEDSDITENSELLELLTTIYAGMELVGPISFAYIGGGFGFGIFNWADIEFQTRGSYNLQFSFLENLLLTAGYAFRVPIGETTLDIGVQLKALGRGSTTSLIQSVLEIMETATSDPLQLLFEGDFYISSGAGLDIGLLYTIADIFSIGLVARDAYTPTWRLRFDSLEDFSDPASEYGTVPCDLSFGIRFALPLGRLHYYLGEPVLYLDYTDILDFLTHPATARNWFLHLGLGLEWHILDIISLRAGFAEGLPGAGLGVDLTFFTIDVAIFGSELSTEPSFRPAYNMIIGFDFTL